MDTTTLALTAFTTLPSIPCIQDTIGHIYSTIQKIRAHRYADIVHKYIAELDVETPIQSIEIFIKKECENNHTNNLCIKRIDQSIQRIHLLLEEIEKKLNDYQNSWIQWLKGINVYYTLEDLKNEKKILESRIDTLLKMIMINRLQTFRA